MIPILFEATETTFDTHGIGDLTDVISWYVTRGKNMLYELEMVYPVDGEYFPQISERSLIYAQPDQVDKAQPFRVYRITKPINGRVNIYARHVCYDLAGIPVNAFTATSATDFASKIKARALTAMPFSFSTNIVASSPLSFDFPIDAHSMVAKWQETYGGEFQFDGYSISLLTDAGENRGVKIQYGLDLVTAQMEENISDVYTGIIPYFWDEQNNTRVVGSVINAAGNFGYSRILAVDVSEYIAEEHPTVAKVNNIGRQWLKENDISTPTVNLRLSYAQIDQVVKLYDTVEVEIKKLGISVKAKVVKTKWDGMKQRYSSVEVGNVRPSLSDDIFDASRLKKGLLPVDRIRPQSITESKIASGAGSSRVLADWSVIRQKLAAKAVGEENLEDEAVSTPKVRGHAVTYDLLSFAVQQLFVDVLEANKIYSGILSADRYVYANAVYTSALTVDNRAYTVATLNYLNWSGAQASAKVLRTLAEF